MRGKKSFDQLAILVQDRRKFLVQMTVNLGAVREMSPDDNISDSTDLHDEHMKMISNLDSSRLEC
jgi:hypothetical protein